MQKKKKKKIDERNFDPHLTLYAKINSKQMRDLDVKPQTIKFQKKIQEKMITTSGLAKVSQPQTPKT